MKVFRRFRATESTDDPEVVEATTAWKKARKEYAALAAAMLHAARPMMESAERCLHVTELLESFQMGQPPSMISILQSTSESEKRTAHSLARYVSLLESNLIPPILHAFDESKSSFDAEKQAYKQARKDLKAKLDKGGEEEDIRLLEETVSSCAKQLTKAIHASIKAAGLILMQNLYTAFRAHRIHHQISLEAYEQELGYVLR
jgi:hypothetical protein